MKKSKVKPEQKPKRVKCERCGKEYDEGAPHLAFCHGKIETGDKCAYCGEGNPNDLHEYGGEILCTACKEEAEDYEGG